jgi:hypothetical protein
MKVDLSGIPPTGAKSSTGRRREAGHLPGEILAGARQ